MHVKLSELPLNELQVHLQVHHIPTGRHGRLIDHKGASARVQFGDPDSPRYAEYASQEQLPLEDLEAFRCDRCGKLIVHASTFSSGYGLMGDKLYCYACCGEIDKEYMIERGHISLYWDEKTQEVINWPGSLRIKIRHSRSFRSPKNGRTYTTVYFRDHLNRPWYGRHYGDDSDILSCKLLK